MTDDREMTINAGMKFLYDTEMVQETPLINHLYLNIYNISRLISEVELLINSEDKQITVYTRLNFFGRIFKFIEKKLVMNIIYEIQELLPNFSVRVTTKIEKWQGILDAQKKKQELEEKVKDVKFVNIVEKE